MSQSQQFMQIEQEARAQALGAPGSTSTSLPQRRRTRKNNEAYAYLDDGEMTALTFGLRLCSEGKKQLSKEGMARAKADLLSAMNSMRAKYGLPNQKTYNVPGRGGVAKALPPYVYPPYFNKKGDLIVPDQGYIRQRVQAGKDANHPRFILLSEGHLRLYTSFVNNKPVVGVDARGKKRYGPPEYAQPVRMRAVGATRRPGMKSTTIGTYISAGGSKVAITEKNFQCSRIGRLAIAGAPGAPAFTPNPSYRGQIGGALSSERLAPGEMIKIITDKDGQQRYAVVKPATGADCSKTKLAGGRTGRNKSAGVRVAVAQSFARYQ
jgi:hypothetical protein